MAEKFKSFVKKQYKPIPIYELPVHGSHAIEKKEVEDRKKLQEKLENHPSVENFRVENPNTHIAHELYKVHDHLEENHSVNYGPKPEYDVMGNEKPVKKTAKKNTKLFNEEEKKHLMNYTEHSTNLNRGLINAHKENRKPFTMTKEHEDLLKKHGEKWDALKWSHEDYDEHSNALYAKENNQMYKDQAKHIDSAMEKTPGVRDKDVYVYHGLKNWHPGVEAAKHPDRHILLPAYTSTSIDPKIAHSFGHTEPHKNTSGEPYYREQKGVSKIHQQHVLKIHVKPEHKGIYIGHNSNHDHESEFLLHRGTVLKIHHKPTIHGDTETKYRWKEDEEGHSYREAYRSKRRTFVWHAEIVGQHDDKQEKN